ncbi:hypothetical protein Tco_1237687 [Tanacetum coccineum]
MHKAHKKRRALSFRALNLGRLEPFRALLAPLPWSLLDANKPSNVISDNQSLLSMDSTFIHDEEEELQVAVMPTIADMLQYLSVLMRRVLGMLCRMLRLIYIYATASDVSTTDDALSRAAAKPSGKNTLCDSQETIAFIGSQVLKRRSEPTASRFYTSVSTHAMNTGSRSGLTYGNFLKPCAYLAERAAHKAPLLSHRSRCLDLEVSLKAYEERLNEADATGSIPVDLLLRFQIK